MNLISSPLLCVALHARLLQRAVDAKHLLSMERILQLAYGCRGRLRHVLERQRDADHKPVPLLHAFPRRWEAARRSAAFPAQAMNPVVALPQLRQPENPSPDSLPLDQVHKWTRRECRQRIPPSLFYKALLVSRGTRCVPWMNIFCESGAQVLSSCAVVLKSLNGARPKEERSSFPLSLCNEYTCAPGLSAWEMPVGQWFVFVHSSRLCLVSLYP